MIAFQLEAELMEVEDVKYWCLTGGVTDGMDAVCQMIIGGVG